MQTEEISRRITGVYYVGSPTAVFNGCTVEIRNMYSEVGRYLLVSVYRGIIKPESYTLHT